jgi:nucleotide-binding universal stress UspA family protein
LPRSFGRRTLAGVGTFPETVVVGFDGSDTARRALDRVADLLRDAATVVLVTVAEPLYSNPRAGAPVDPREADERDQTLSEGKALLAARGIAARSLPAVGDPAEAILEAAREADADMIVVGSRGRGRLARIALGSVSSKVAQDADRSVLVVR